MEFYGAATSATQEPQALGAQSLDSHDSRSPDLPPRGAVVKDRAPPRQPSSLATDGWLTVLA